MPYRRRQIHCLQCWGVWCTRCWPATWATMSKTCSVSNSGLASGVVRSSFSPSDISYKHGSLEAGRVMSHWRGGKLDCDSTISLELYNLGFIFAQNFLEKIGLRNTLEILFVEFCDAFLLTYNLREEGSQSEALKCDFLLWCRRGSSGERGGVRLFATSIEY
jgi:hypothetical protein